MPAEGDVSSLKDAPLLKGEGTPSHKTINLSLARLLSIIEELSSST